MRRFRIHNQRSGQVIGVYEADSPFNAVKMMAEEAGYSSVQYMDRVAPGAADRVVTEVFLLDPDVWTLEPLNRETGRWSLRCTDPDVMETINSGGERWPSDEVVSELCGEAVVFQSSGDDVSEGIYLRAAAK